MIAYPISLKSQSGNSLHTFELVEGNTPGSGFEPLSLWLKLPLAKDATHKCGLCGAILEIPDGNLQTHLTKYQAQRGGKDVIVRIVYHHKGPFPRGTRLSGVKLSEAGKLHIGSFEDYIKWLESSNQDRK